jgi:hypothetical protein
MKTPRLRQGFIGRRLEAGRKVNREDLVCAFEISAGQAARDLAAFKAAHPGAMVYDTHRKAYVAGGTHG